MRKFAFIAPPAAVMAALVVAGAAQAQPAVNVTIGQDLQERVEKLGDRAVDEQVSRLRAEVEQALAQRYPGASAELVLTDLKPNRPTMQQVRDTPGLDPIRSISIGGAAVEGSIVTADGERRPVKFSYYSPSIRDVDGFGIWHDADRAFDRLGANIKRGRY
jgi:hypothetical protein